MSVPQNIKIIAATWLDSSQDVETTELVELLDWVRTQMRVELAKHHAAAGKEPTSNSSFGTDELVLNIAIELDLAPWSSKAELSDEDLASARLLCRAAGFPDVEDPHEVITLRSKLEQTEAQRGNACEWALLYKRVSEGRPEPEGVRGTVRPLSLALDDLDIIAEPVAAIRMEQWRTRALKAEATLADVLAAVQHLGGATDGTPADLRGKTKAGE